MNDHPLQNRKQYNKIRYILFKGDCTCKYKFNIASAVRGQLIRTLFTANLFWSSFKKCLKSKHLVFELYNRLEIHMYTHKNRYLL